MPNKLTISMDYDDTFTADPEYFTQIAELAKQRGHTVICVTSRNESLGNRQELSKALPSWIPIVFADDPNNKDESALKAGYHVDVWWDDVPESIRPS